jgi:tetratricopeptide (TPR) repeat protein
MTMTRRALRLCLPVLLSVLAAAPAPAQSLDDVEEYEACMTLAQRTPSAAYSSARSWAERGGGAPAQHCGAVALINMKKPKDGAQLLERAGALMKEKDPAMAAELYAQAGQAWSMANDTTRALNAQNAGLALAPDNVDLLVDRAFSHMGKGDYRAAVADLDKAHGLATDRPDVLAYRASAWRFIGDNGKALAEAEAALKLDSDNVEALLERGNIRRLTDDPKGAKADWLQVVELAAGTPAGDMAKANLEKLKQAAQ